ncbi:MAG: hypothetical protein ABI882_06710, partial [Acidobacteriota bacterium]
MKPVSVRTIAFLTLFSMNAGAAWAQTSPRVPASQFYQTYLKLNIRGLPDSAEHKQFLALLDPSLRQLFETAKLEQTKFIKEHPDEKPPWIEGDLFSSLFEGARVFRIAATRVRGRRAEVDVRLEHKEGTSVVRWTDTLVLSRDGDARRGRP